MSSSESCPRFDAVFSRASLQGAWDHVQRRAAGPGIDRMSVERFARDAGARLDALHADLHAGSYRPKPTLAIVIESDPDRPLAVSCVADRIVQRALADALSPFYDKRWVDAVCAFRKGRGVEDALSRVEHHLAAGRRWFARTDIAKFFDEIDRDRLLSALTDDGLDRSTRAVVRRLLKAGVHRGAVARDPGRGIGQGSALSPLLSNVYLRPVDRALTDMGIPYLRYADDILVLGETETGVLDALELLDARARGLGLRLNAHKTRRGHVGSGFDFLGFRFDSRGRRLATGALHHLRSEAAARLTDPPALTAWARSWSRWYGDPGPDADTLPVLAAAALAHREPASVLELARRRLAARAPLPAVLHEALAEVWASVDDDATRQALVLDAHGALTGDGRPADRQRIARVLGISAALLDALDGPLDGWSAALGPMGHAELAAIARGLVRAPAKASSRAFSVTSESAAALLERLGGARDEHVVEQVDHRGHLRWMPAARPLTVERVVSHLEGGPRRAVYAVSADGMVRCATIEVRIRRAALLERPASELATRATAFDGMASDHALAIVRAASRLDWPAHLEHMGPRRRRVWFILDEALPLRHVARMLVRLEERLGDAPPEVLRHRTPFNDRPGNGRGPYIALPLGRDKRTGAAATWLARDGHPAAQPLTAIVAAATVESARLRPQVIDAPIQVTPDPWRITVDQPRARTVLEGCAMLSALASKAARIGRLEGIERASLYESLAHLPEGEREPALVRILEPTGDTRRAVRRRMARTPRYPISCPTIRKRHPTLAAEVGCDCRFSGLQGAYPTPVLHACRPGEIDAFTRRGRATTGRRDRPRANPTGGPAAGASVGAVASQSPPSAPTPSKEIDTSTRTIDVPVGHPPACRPETRQSEQLRAPDTVAADPCRSGEGASDQLDEACGETPELMAADRGTGQGVSDPPGKASGADAHAFRDALHALYVSRRALSDAREAVAEAQRALDTLFDAADRDVIDLPEGRLRRMTDGPKRFRLEL